MASLPGFPFYASAPVISAGTVTNNTTVTPGQSILITASAASNVTITLPDATTVVVTPQVGDNIYPFATTKAVVNSGTVTSMYNLFVSS